MPGYVPLQPGVPETLGFTVCGWWMGFKAYNDGPANHPNTDGINAITRTNTLQAGNFSTPAGLILPYVAASAPVTISPPVGDFGITKGFSGSAIGDQFVASINLTNNNKTDSLAVQNLTDDLSTMYVASQPCGYSCHVYKPSTLSFSPGCGSSPAATFGAGSGGAPNTLLTVTPGSLVIPPGGQCTISVGAYTSLAVNLAWAYNTISAYSATASYLSNPSATVQNTADAVAGKIDWPIIKSTVKSFSSSITTADGTPAVLSGFAGSVARLTLVYTVWATNTTVDLAFTDTFPTAPWPLQVAANPDAQSSCGGQITATPGAGSFSLAGGTITGDGVKDQTCTISLNVSAPAGASGVDYNQVLNGQSTAQDLAAPVANSKTSNTGDSNKAAIAAINVLPAIAKEFNPTSVTLNGGVSSPSTLTITVTNQQTDNFTATNVSYSDTLPTGMQFAPGAVALLNGDATCVAGVPVMSNGNQLTVTFSSLAVTKTPCTLTVPVIATVAGSLTNTIPAGSFVSDQKLSNLQPVSASLLSLGTADLYVTKTDNVNQRAGQGAHVQYAVVVGNKGRDAIVGASVSDIPPPDITISKWSCTPSGKAGDACPNPASGSGTLTDVLVNLSVNGSVTFTLDATVSATAKGDLTNTAKVQLPSSVADPDPSNNTATDTIKVTMDVDVGAVWSNIPANFMLNQVASGLTLTCSNNGPVEAVNVICAPSVSTGAINNLVCYLQSDAAKTPLALPVTTTLTAHNAVVCTFDYQAPFSGVGTVTFTGTTNTTGDTNPSNNTAIATALFGDNNHGDNIAPVPMEGRWTLLLLSLILLIAGFLFTAQQRYR